MVVQKKLSLVLPALLLVPGVAAQLEVKVDPGTCPPGFNSLVSVYEPNSTTGNPGVPEVQPPTDISPLYRNQVCVGGVEEPTIEDSCPGSPGFYLFSRGTVSHFSNKSVYPLEACTGRLQVVVRRIDQDADGSIADDPSNPCKLDEKRLFSISNHTNAHIASPYKDFYPFKACGFLNPFAPESVDIRLSFNLSSDDAVRSDADSLDPGEKKTSFEYPYIASSDGTAVTGLASKSSNTTIRRLNDTNTLILARAPPDFGTVSASVLVPFTRGGFESIESREDAVLGGGLLERTNPSFGFPNAESSTNTISTRLDPEFNISNNLSLTPGTYELELEKTADESLTVRRE